MINIKFIVESQSDLSGCEESSLGLGRLARGGSAESFIYVDNFSVSDDMEAVCLIKSDSKFSIQAFFLEAFLGLALSLFEAMDS